MLTWTLPLKRPILFSFHLSSCEIQLSYTEVSIFKQSQFIWQMFQGLLCRPFTSRGGEAMARGDSSAWSWIARHILAFIGKALTLWVLKEKNTNLHGKMYKTRRVANRLSKQATSLFCCKLILWEVDEWKECTYIRRASGLRSGSTHRAILQPTEISPDKQETNT